MNVVVVGDINDRTHTHSHRRRRQRGWGCLCHVQEPLAGSCRQENSFDDTGIVYKHACVCVCVLSVHAKKPIMHSYALTNSLSHTHVRTGSAPRHCRPATSPARPYFLRCADDQRGQVRWGRVQQRHVCAAQGVQEIRDPREARGVAGNTYALCVCERETERECVCVYMWCEGSLFIPVSF
jgi:hypothetical protein